ncbi:GNAT family N-acetyltransferase [Pontivivens ytuae]|uniref:GNAT family N-acetyltransferase n=1 Tax=Pontivivens ytuae TaxID=2789856 RepID=A0A7S9LRP2_9RHOB|nr:GNAT family N-acetyltransferase [Pontivivens ytuae]QPH53891.1 GNAT family N-acetyltransferase [Pontivivens ytuae]
MSVSLEPVTRDDVIPLTDLAVHAEQRGFVADNAFSLAQAPYETGAYPFAIRADGRLVGFCMVIDMREHQYRERCDDPQSCFLWRFMIAAEEQGKGYGRATLAEVEAWARARGLTALVTTAVEGNAAARALYRSAGFVETGRIAHGEVEMRRPLD